MNYNFYDYITTNVYKTVLYTGVTNNLYRRLSEHLEDSKGKRKTFAGKYNCHNLIFYEHFDHIDHAISREKEIKGWLRSKKEDLIKESNPEWKFLNDEIDPF